MTRKKITNRMRRMTLASAVAFGLGVLGSWTVQAADAPGGDTAAVAVGQLPELARTQAKGFQAIPAEKVKSAREAAQTSVRKLDRVLAGNPAKVRDGWNKFLKLEGLRAKLQDSDAKPEDLAESITLFTEDQAGLEWHHFVDVRKAVAEYIELASTAADEKAAETHATTLEALAGQLDEYAKAPTPELSRSIGRGLGLLRRTRQAPELVAAIDRHYTLPNLRLDASHKFLAAGIEQPVEQSAYVVDNVLGATVRSSVKMTGDLKVELVPNDSYGGLRLLLSGSAHSNSIGTKGPVTVYTTGLTSVSAEKDLRITADGFASDPAQASCSTSTNINSISAKCNLIRKMAWKQASKSQGQAESIASRNAASRIASQMDRETLDMVDESNSTFQQKFRARLTRRGQSPRTMSFSTTADRLGLVMLQSGDGHVAAPSAAPELPTPRDVNIRLHESFVGNMSEALLGGVTLTDEKLADLVKDFAGEVPEELQIGPDKDPWSITFSGEHPIAVTFTDKTLSIVIHGRRFTRGDREIRDPARIAATYTIEKTPTGSKLTRQGDLEVEYVSIKGGQSVSQVAFRTFLRKKFESMLKAEIVSDGVKLKGRWEKAGKLAVQDLQLSPGWLTLGWNLVAVDARTAARD